ncbi:hypothetical protein E8E14_014140 [Neopestalotiopsis sp. 37M]|nr:hypothetical protein E8E14_014140 [Neopestalotiopsis sp. 37M]
MARDEDVERGSLKGDERTPLLREIPPVAIEEDEDEHQSGPASQNVRGRRDELDESSLLEPPPPQPRTKGWWAWRIFWFLVAALVLALFIKGWIDADDTNFDLSKALKRALGGGLSGAAAMVLQVLLLMTLYHEGGFRRYYAGLLPALVQGPVSRFGDTAANAGILALLQSNSYLARMPTLIQTIFASLCAAAFRMILTPIDTLKTTMQAQGSRGTALLRQRIKTEGIGSLWWGAFATAAATFVGHYPWFATYNFLTEFITQPPKEQLALYLLRLAFIGFCASVISDTISNSLRVVKTYRQVNDTEVSYSQAAKLVIQQDGISGLFGRGLPTRILANGLQGILFSILWKLFLDLWVMLDVTAQRSAYNLSAPLALSRDLGS